MVREIHDDACFSQGALEFSSEAEALDLKEQLPEGWHFEGECG